MSALFYLSVRYFSFVISAYISLSMTSLIPNSANALSFLIQYSTFQNLPNFTFNSHLAEAIELELCPHA